MPQIINTNIASLTAQRNLNSSQNSLNTSLQRLSSGLRINSAKDDAAGLAISERFTTQIRGLNQASRNANDAISLSQTAEGALGEIGNNLQRIRELAVQSANATNSASDREALDLEVQQRLAEIDRIAGQTSFNGQKILDGTFGVANFQVGANAGETISLDLATSVRQDSIGAAATVESSGSVAAAFAGSTGFQVNAGELSISFNGGTAVDVATDTYASAAELRDAINAAHLESGGDGSLATINGDAITVTNSESTGTVVITGDDAETAGIDGTLALAAASAPTDSIASTTFDSVAIGAGDLQFTYADLSNTVDVATGVYDKAELVDAINAAATTANGGAGITVAVLNGTTGNIELDNTVAASPGGNGALTISGTKTGSLGIDGTNLVLDEDGSGGDVNAIDDFATFDKQVITASQLNVDIGDGSGSTSVVAGTYDDAGLIAALNVAAGGATIASAGAAGAITISNSTTNDFAFTGTDADALGLIAIAKQFTADVGTSITSEYSFSNPSTPFEIASGELNITVGTGTAVSISGSFASGAELASEITEKVDGLRASFDTTTNRLSFEANGSITLAGTGTPLTDLNLSAGQTDAEGDLSTVSIDSVEGANDAIFRVDDALTSISNLRSTFGAIQNRFESTISNLDTAVESLSAARSRIQDADFASETAALTRAQILQQAGVSILSQANSLPQSVLGLLQ